MRRALEIRVTFRPTRVAAERLRAAYDLVDPVRSRRLQDDPDTVPSSPSEEHDVDAHDERLAQEA